MKSIRAVNQRDNTPQSNWHIDTQKNQNKIRCFFSLFTAHLFLDVMNLFNTICHVQFCCMWDLLQICSQIIGADNFGTPQVEGQRWLEKTKNIRVPSIYGPTRQVLQAPHIKTCSPQLQLRDTHKTMALTTKIKQVFNIYHHNNRLKRVNFNRVLNLKHLFGSD